MEISGGHTWSSITPALGGFHTCGITTAGDGYCWGNNQFNQLASGLPASSVVPVEISGGNVWASITAGAVHNCGITTGGDGYCWGNRALSQIGDGKTTDSSVPREVSGNHTWASINAGDGHTCGVTTAGDGYCWGYAEFGQIGDGSTYDGSPPAINVPVEVSGSRTWSSINAGYTHTCGVTIADDAYCWGDNTAGQLGNNGANIGSNTPNQVSGGQAWASITAGGGFTCGVTTAGGGYCWGYNDLGAVGDGTVTQRATPAEVVTPWAG